MNLTELRDAVENLDEEGNFDIFDMNDFDKKLFEGCDGYSYDGGDFNSKDDYYYFFDGNMISISKSKLYDFYEAALDELTEGEYSKDKHLENLEISNRFMKDDELAQKIKETNFLLKKANEAKIHFEDLLESLLDEKEKRENEKL